MLTQVVLTYLSKSTPGVQSRQLTNTVMKLQGKWVGAIGQGSFEDRFSVLLEEP